MSALELVTGIVLVALPVQFNAFFALLGARFDYPDILRRPTAQVLERFRAGGTGLVLTWWGFGLSAVALAPAAVLVSEVAGGADATILALATTAGVLAAAVQFLGLMRWPFVVPYLARAAADPEASEARREAVDIVFQSLNRYLGVAIGEHLGYALTGAWSALVGVALIQAGAVPAWIAAIGIAVAPLLAFGALEFVGRHERDGWALPGKVVPVAYVVWSVWLAATGVALLLG
jgi:Domain of unknown function (DUF4386)